MGIIRRVTTSIARLAREAIRKPEGRDVQLVKQEFNAIHHFPNVIGALDRTPLMSGSRILAGMKANGFVTETDIFPSIFENDEFPNCFLLGDSAYPCRLYLLTPLQEPTNDAEVRYQQSHIATRNPVERIFGVWKKRFPVLARGMRTNLQTTLRTIIATAVLYNFAIQRNDDLPAHNENLPNEIPAEPARQQQRNATRTYLIETVFSRRKDSMRVIENVFSDRIISHGLCPARSPDLNPWGSLKLRVYRNNPHTLEELKNNIHDKIELINKNELQQLFNNLIKRLKFVLISKVGILNISCEDLDSDEDELNIELDREFDELVSDNEDASTIIGFQTISDDSSDEEFVLPYKRRAVPLSEYDSERENDSGGQNITNGNSFDVDHSDDDENNLQRENENSGVQNIGVVGSLSRGWKNVTRLDNYVLRDNFSTGSKAVGPDIWSWLMALLCWSAKDM
ncbi:hypothetical protein C0J52_20243 [Blattella germanica]|nr:hypothetical protein C0J52_20243 [Blattella germanica]